MRIRALAIGLGVACTSSLIGGASALAATRCVGGGHPCHRTIQSALDASRDGDAIKVAPGTFAGGIEITKSVSLSGSGSEATAISGGGPVVTVGVPGDATPPAVSIAGVKVTGGRTSASPPTDFSPGGTAQAFGGGVYVPPGAGGAKGATLSIRDSAISGNRAAPTTVMLPNDDQLPFWPTCPDDPCPYAEADGAGIDNWGDLRLTRTVVSDNEAGGPLTSDALGAGVWSDLGSLTVVDSVLARNRSVVVAPNGRFAEGGGLLVHGGGPVAIRNTLVDHNAAKLTSTLPPLGGGRLIDAQSHAGGILIADGVPSTIDRSVLSRNSASAHNPAGEPLAFDAALQVLDTSITLSNTLITGNRVVSDTLTTEHVGPAGSAVELDGGGTLTNVHIVGNSVDARAADRAGATGGLAVYDFSGSPDPVRVVDSTISGNRAVARSPAGSAQVIGAGVLNNSLLELRRTVVGHNEGRASAPGGVAQGGGIWNGVFLTGPPVELTLAESLITRNAVTGGGGVERQGGGLYTTEPVTRTRTPIAGNAPDQCFGCGGQAPLAARTAASSATSRGSSGASIGSADTLWLKIGKSRWPQPRNSLSSWWKAPSTVSTRPGT